MTAWRLSIWLFVVFNFCLVLISSFYAYQYFTLRNITAIKKRRVKLMAFLNCMNILFIIRSGVCYLLFYEYFYSNQHLDIFLNAWYILNVEICIWFTCLKFWMAFFDIQWTKSCERDQWKVCFIIHKTFLSKKTRVY